MGHNRHTCSNMAGRKRQIRPRAPHGGKTPGTNHARSPTPSNKCPAERPQSPASSQKAKTGGPKNALPVCPQNGAADGSREKEQQTAAAPPTPVRAARFSHRTKEERSYVTATGAGIDKSAITSSRRATGSHRNNTRYPWCPQNACAVPPPPQAKTPRPRPSTAKADGESPQTVHLTPPRAFTGQHRGDADAQATPRSRASVPTSDGPRPGATRSPAFGGTPSGIKNRL